MKSMSIRALTLLTAAVIAMICLVACTGQAQTVNTDWEYGQVAMGGSGFVTGVFATCEENIYYARTDVGGAYRWDEENKLWVPLSCSVGADETGYLGIESLATAADDAGMVYMLAGTSYFNNGRTAVFSSSDYGETWEVTEVSELIRCHGNGYGRQNGERLAVDPLNSDLILVGGRTGGIIKSTDGGKTFSSLSTFTITSTSNGNGVNAIVFDPSTSAGESSTKRIFVSVSRKGDDNIFVSENGGETWNAVAGLPKEYMPLRMKLDANGRLLITYAESEGPSTGGQGAIYRYDPNTNKAEDISPSQRSFGDVVANPEDPDMMVACTISIYVRQSNGSYGDEFYVTEDGGKTWQLINSRMKMTFNASKGLESYSMHWCGSMMIDPFDPDTIMVVSGNGIYRCDNIWDDEPEFKFFVKGLEETVPHECVSIPNGVLLTTISDYDGFENTDPREYGRRHTYPIGTTGSIAVAGANTSVWAKVGSVKPLYTVDAGDSWHDFANMPEGVEESSGGQIALTADGERIIWCTTKFAGVYYTDNYGETWEKVKGILGGYKVMGDKVDPGYVYAGGENSFFVSKDGGKTFTKTFDTDQTAPRITASQYTAGLVYIPNDSKGLWASSDYGMTFEKVGDVSYCRAVGLGKGKSAGDHEVIYIWGKPGEKDAEGAYMSEDNGKTWSRVNDELHEYGGLGNGGFISGDYNVYGRCYFSTAGMGVVWCDKIDKE